MPEAVLPVMPCAATSWSAPSPSSLPAVTALSEMRDYSGGVIADVVKAAVDRQPDPDRRFRPRR